MPEDVPQLRFSVEGLSYLLPSAFTNPSPNVGTHHYPLQQMVTFVFAA